MQILSTIIHTTMLVVTRLNMEAIVLYCDLVKSISQVRKLRATKKSDFQDDDRGIDGRKSNAQYLQEDVADEDEVEFDNKYEGDEINGDDICSLNSILNENELEEDHRASPKI